MDSEFNSVEVRELIMADLGVAEGREAVEQTSQDMEIDHSSPEERVKVKKWNAVALWAWGNHIDSEEFGGLVILMRLC